MLYFGNLKAINMDLFPTYPGTLTIDWLSIVLIAIVVLFALGGIARGAAKTFLNNFGGIINLAISFIVAALLCNVLANMDFASSIKNPIHDWIAGLGDESVRAVLNEPHSRDEILMVLTNNGYAVLTQMFIPPFLSFVCPFVCAFFGSCVPEVPTEASVADNIATEEEKEIYDNIDKIEDYIIEKQKFELSKEYSKQKPYIFLKDNFEEINHLEEK